MKSRFPLSLSLCEPVSAAEMRDRHLNPKCPQSLVKNNGQTIITGKAMSPQSPGKSQNMMDPTIWSQLPPELLEYVLCFLPIKTLLNLRSTCKHFNSLLFSPSFISKHSSSSPFSSFLILSHPQSFQHLLLYDSVIGHWRTLALSLSLLLPSASPSITLLSTSNGLFCFSLPNSSSFVVCNLMAKSSRVIEFPSFPFDFELLTLVSTPLGYKIFLLSSGSSSNSALLYNSDVHSWRQFDGFQPILTDNYQQEGAYYKGCMYFATTDPFSVVFIDLESGKWGILNIELPAELTFARLVSDGEGKLYLIGGIGRNGISRSLKLWEFGEERNWVEVETLPELMCRKFLSVCYHNYEHVYCFWHQGMICICCYTWPEILYYKVSRMTWHWLPKSPSLPEKWSCGFKWFSFVPHLYAAV